MQNNYPLLKKWRFIIKSAHTSEQAPTHFSLCLLFLGLGLIFNPLQAQEAPSPCGIDCEERIGNDAFNLESAWGSVNILTKSPLEVSEAVYFEDQLATYSLGGNSFYGGSVSEDRLDFGIGVEGEGSSDPRRNAQINYFPELGLSDRILIDFGNCQEFTGANVALSRFYASEKGDLGESGGWRALDENFNEIATGFFNATEILSNGGAGLYEFRIVTPSSFRYLEFVALPYISSKTDFSDDSDYFIQSIQPTCFDALQPNSVLGGDGGPSSWAQTSLFTKGPIGSLFSPQKTEDIFVFEDEDVIQEEGGGLGVPGKDGDPLINYDEEGSEELQIFIGYEFQNLQVTFSQLFTGEIAQWTTYDIKNFQLVEVSSGFIEGDDISPFEIPGTTFRPGSGNKTVETESGSVVVFKGTTTIETKDAGANAFLVYEIIVDPICEGSNQVISYQPGYALGNDGVIRTERMNPNSALGSDDDDDSGVINATSLGFGGELVLKFSTKIANIEGADFQIIETTPTEDGVCESFPERAEVYASENGEAFTFLGIACRDDAYFDLGNLDFAEFIKIVDISDPEAFASRPYSDGYDVNSIQCLSPNEVPLPGDDGDESASIDEIWLEAECADLIGRVWNFYSDEAASQNTALVVPDAPEQEQRYDIQGQVDANFLLSFEFEAEEAQYELFAHILAPSADDDSFWISVNGGEWIRWWRGLQTGSEFRWKKVLNSPFALEEGLNQIRIAAREYGTILDKIYFVKSELEITPEGLGGEASNCSEEEEEEEEEVLVVNEVWLEAECADLVGEQWRFYEDERASRNVFVMVPDEDEQNSKYVIRGEADPSFILSFEFEAENSDYELFAHISAPSANDDSFWVSINGGEWIQWWQGLQTGQRFQWKKVLNSPFNLQEGSNQIRIAAREHGTMLDKLYLVKADLDVVPEGLGEFASNCRRDPSRNTDRPLLTLDPEVISIYPNPIRGQVVKISFTQDVDKDVSYQIYNQNGQLIYNGKTMVNGKNLEIILPAKAQKSGMYYLRMQGFNRKGKSMTLLKK